MTATVHLLPRSLSVSSSCSSLHTYNTQRGPNMAACTSGARAGHRPQPHALLLSPVYITAHYKRACSYKQTKRTHRKESSVGIEIIEICIWNCLTGVELLFVVADLWLLFCHLNRTKRYRSIRHTVCWLLTDRSRQLTQRTQLPSGQLTQSWISWRTMLRDDFICKCRWNHKPSSACGHVWQNTMWVGDPGFIVVEWHEVENKHVLIKHILVRF